MCGYLLSSVFRFNVGREALNFEDEGASPSAAAIPLKCGPYHKQ